MTQEHGVSILSRLFDALDGRTIHVTQHVIRNVRSGDGVSETADPSVDFERAVLAVIDRRHRRQSIAQN